jgi:uncharacterized alpha-E superfamily protein
MDGERFMNPHCEVLERRFSIMSEFEKDVNRTKEAINKERKDIGGKDLGDRASEMTHDALARIEKSLTDLNTRMKDRAYDLSSLTREKANDFGHDLDKLRLRIKNQRREIMEKGLEKRSEEVIDDVKNTYNKIVDKYLKK